MTTEFKTLLELFQVPLFRKIIADHFYASQRKEKNVNLLEGVDSEPADRHCLDEVSLCNLIKLSGRPGRRKKFLDDDINVMKFWYDRKKTFPTLFEVAARLFAILVSSAASERVFLL